MTSVVFTFTKIVVCILVLVILNINFLSNNDTSPIFCNGYNIKYRTATSSDVSLARDILLQQTMNPFSVKDENLLIAYDADEITKWLAHFQQFMRGCLKFDMIKISQWINELC